MTTEQQAILDEVNYYFRMTKISCNHIVLADRFQRAYKIKSKPRKRKAKCVGYTCTPKTTN